jgi:RIO kinase 1
MIDVSQSVEHEHPQALEFLRKDCTNVVDFFRKYLGPSNVFTVRELFEFVIKEKSILKQAFDIEDTDELLSIYLEKAHNDIKIRPKLRAQTEVDDEVFKQVYIPQSLTEITDVESQILKMDDWDVRDSQAYKSIVKMENNLSVVENEASDCLSSDIDSEPEDSESSSDISDDDSDSSSYIFEEREPKGKKFEDKQLKKERKKVVREEKSEKRKVKMPKSVKKRKIKTCANKKKK